MFITAAILRSIAENVPGDRRIEQARIINSISLNINEQLLNVRITGPDQLALFFALLVLDSSYLSLTDESPQSDTNGNLFGARGLLKIRGRENYRKFGRLLAIDLENSPHVVAEPTIAIHLAKEIWNAHYGGRVAIDDIRGISQEFASRGRVFPAQDYHLCLMRTVAVLEGSERAALATDLARLSGRSAGATYTVWYGTNRRPTVDGLNYSSDRDEEVHYGKCDVFVPKSHKIGSIGSSLIKRALSGNDDRIRLIAVKPLSVETYWKCLQETFDTAEEPKTAIVLVHGYNVSFESAAIRAAQIGYDLCAQRAMAFFSWPSQGKLSGYLADAATIEVSEAAIASFLIDFAERSGAEKVHVIAHSMGNRGVLRAINRIAARATAQSGKIFGQIILAAADVDADLFKQYAAPYVELSQRTSIYISSRDKAVEASHWLHEFPRVGLTPPTLVIDGIDTISVSNVDMSILGHGYFAEARNVLADLYELIAHGAPPAMRFGLRKAKAEDGRSYWLVKP
ncbi:alpha/beta hydrolase [Bradyrhizobium sp. LTSPM299]|uniref:alpha/beta hydrolase n=1 Tax=Bradyrhizobium sp. LTSPM299 TaxID=1619233 RepID=UPI0009E437C6|nr:alpha/beta hydrolase [Bradyrhizobium sp. LTSPM299]